MTDSAPTPMSDLGKLALAQFRQRVQLEQNVLVDAIARADSKPFADGWQLDLQTLTWHRRTAAAAAPAPAPE